MTARLRLRPLLALTLLMPACGDDIANDDEASTGDSDGESTADGSGSGGEGSSGSESSGSGSESGTADTSSSGTADSNDTGTADSTADSNDTGTADSSGSGTDTGEDSCPIDGTWPYAGVLCGPDDLPCTLAVEHELDDPAFRNDAPAIAVGDGCQPHVLFSVAENGYFGFYATDDGGGWEVESTPLTMAQGGLVVDPATQIPTAVVDDGAYGVSTWTRDPDWQQLDAFAGMHHFNHGLARSLDGTIHAGYRTGLDDLRHGSFEAGSWTVDNLEGKGLAVNLGLSVAESPQITAWFGGQGEWMLLWQVPGGGVEQAATYGSSALEVSAHAIAVVGGDGNDPTGTPHLLHALAGPDFDAPISLAYSTRVGLDQWTTAVFADDQTAESCSFEPAEAGLECDYDYVRHHPIAAVASEGGDVRLLWSRIHHTGTLMSMCTMGGPLLCYWTLQEDTSTGALWIGWPEGDSVAGAELGESFALTGTAALDSSGNMHVAVYDLPPNADGSTVRYLQLKD